MEADVESRKTEMRTEWKLNVDVFNNVMTHFQFHPKIDLFASRINTQLETFISYRPDPEAAVIDAFSVTWENLDFYCFPPFSCLGKVIQKIIYDQATGILIAPDWPNQLWYTQLQDILVCGYFVISPSVNQLHLPNQPLISHPLFKDLTLMACFESGKV